MAEREKCCMCDEATGRAGIADGSLFIDLPNGEHHGPLCSNCYDDGLLYAEMWGDYEAVELTQANARIKELEKTDDIEAVVEAINEKLSNDPWRYEDDDWVYPGAVTICLPKDTGAIIPTEIKGSCHSSDEERYGRFHWRAKLLLAKLHASEYGCLYQIETDHEAH